MNYKNGQLLSRLVFLGIFGLIILGVFWMGGNLSKSQQPASIGDVAADFIPAEEGKAVLVEFSDFQCPACRAYYPLVRQLRGEFGDKLTVEYKYFPLKNIHKNAEISARAGEAARLQGKFDEMEDLLFTKQNDWAFSNDVLSYFRDYATTIGLDTAKFNSDIELSSVYDKVNADYREGLSLGVNGTPTFFLNGKKITNPGSYDQFSQLIKQALE